MAKSAATVSQRTVGTILAAVGMLGFFGIVAAFAMPVPTNNDTQSISIPAPVVAAKTPTVTPTTGIPSPATEHAAGQNAIQPPQSPTYAIASFIPRPAQFNHGDWIWNDEGVPTGPVLVIVDVKTQLMHVFRAGREIGTAVVLYGADDSPTPLGTFPIMDKDIDHVSSVFGAPMPYNLRLTGDGVAVHGSNVRWGWGTNGCVCIPNAFAKLLFDQVKVGDKVVIVKGKTPQPGQSIPLI